MTRSVAALARALRRALRVIPPLVRVTAAIVAITRLSRAARAAPPVIADGAARAAAADRAAATIDVVIPARDEAERIGPAIAALRGAPGVASVIVVDDQSTDATTAVATASGATVVEGGPLPPGWAGKAWAVHQGITASSADWIVTLDADTRADPRLPASIVDRAISDGLDFVTVGGRFECPTGPTRWLHASMLTSLVYRFGPPGVPRRPSRMMANGQCMAFRRRPFSGQGGMSGVRAEVVEDVALVRRLAGRGWSVAFLDAPDLLRVRMFESLRDTWTGWGRSLALPGVEPEHRQMIDLVVVALAQAAPIPRLLLGRGDVLDVVLVAVRLGTLVGTRTAYDRTDAAYWLSPLADLGTVAAIAGGISRGEQQEWRGRRYG